MIPQTIFFINSNLSIADEIIELSNDSLQVLVYEEDDTFENIYNVLEDEFVEMQLDNKFIQNICIFNEKDYILRNKTKEEFIDFLTRIINNFDIKSIDFHGNKIFYESWNHSLIDLQNKFTNSCTINIAFDGKIL